MSKLVTAVPHGKYIVLTGKDRFPQSHRGGMSSDLFPSDHIVFTTTTWFSTERTYPYARRNHFDNTNRLHLNELQLLNCITSQRRGPRPRTDSPNVPRARTHKEHHRLTTRAQGFRKLLFCPCSQSRVGPLRTGLISPVSQSSQSVQSRVGPLRTGLISQSVQSVQSRPPAHGSYQSAIQYYGELRRTTADVCELRRTTASYGELRRMSF